jgi:hypothetical protein
MLKSLTQKKNNKKSSESIAISSAYFNLQKEFVQIGYKCFNVPWLEPNNNLLLYYKLQKFKNNIKECKFSEFDLLLKEYLIIRNELTNYFSKIEIKVLILPQDMGVFERMSIRIFKELKKKSYVFSHGLPGRYNNIDDNKTDYLVVWGKKIKENYVKYGINDNKILVSGHPVYKNYTIENIKLRSSLSKILVLSKSINGTPHSVGVGISDRTNSLLYLSQIKNELLKLGVKSVKLRLHPSENIDWFRNYIDTNFFDIDLNKSVIKSINEATLVIGPTSSVFLESLLSGVNYILFEPTLKNGYSFDNVKLVPPFDNSDNRVPCANDINTLKDILKNKKEVDCTIIKDYCSDKFEIEMITKIITKNIV